MELEDTLTWFLLIWGETPAGEEYSFKDYSIKETFVHVSHEKFRPYYVKSKRAKFLWPVQKANILKCSLLQTGKILLIYEVCFYLVLPSASGENNKAIACRETHLILNCKYSSFVAILISVTFKPYNEIKCDITQKLKCLHLSCFL